MSGERPRREARRAPPPPTRDEVEGQFAAIIAGRTSRDAADRWAAQWVAAELPGFQAVDDPLIWDALGLLHGIEMPGLDGAYLHDDAQIAEWLSAFQRSRQL